MSKTVFDKEVVSGIKKSKMSPFRARRLKRAIINISSSNIENLCKSGRVKKLKIQGYEDLYAYRVSSSERIVFSLINGQKIIHDIVDTNKIEIK